MRNSTTHNMTPEYLNVIKSYMYDDRVTYNIAMASKCHYELSQELLKSLQFIQYIDQMAEFMSFRDARENPYFR